MDAIAASDIGHSEIIKHYSACTAKALNAVLMFGLTVCGTANLRISY